MRQPTTILEKGTKIIAHPKLGPLSHAIHGHLLFGSTDGEIEQAGKDFVTKMKSLRDGVT